MSIIAAYSVGLLLHNKSHNRASDRMRVPEGAADIALIEFRLSSRLQSVLRLLQCDRLRALKRFSLDSVAATPGCKPLTLNELEHLAQSTLGAISYFP